MVLEERIATNYVDEYQRCISLTLNDRRNSTHARNSVKTGHTVQKALISAKNDGRIITGLNVVSQVLSQTPEQCLFCVIAVAKDGDSVSHMQEVLLEAFCYEHDIYVIKIDCAIKLGRLLGTHSSESCCLIQKSDLQLVDNDGELLNESESVLVDYCETYWNATYNPTVKLPNL